MKRKEAFFFFFFEIKHHKQFQIHKGKNKQNLYVIIYFSGTIYNPETKKKGK